MNIRIVLTALLIIVSPLSFAGGKVPTETQGITPITLHQNNLGAQINLFQDYDIRARRIIFAPGATVAPHSHAERPGIVYVESGVVVESRNGRKRKFKEGDTWIEKASTNHWVKNPSKKKEAVIIVIDLPAQQ